MYQMQISVAASYPPLAGLSRRRYPKKTSVQTQAYREPRPGAPISDLSAVYPEAVLASSKDLGWQDIRVLHVRNQYGDMNVPPLENHCVIVQLEPSDYVTATINGQAFDNLLSLGDITIIPAGASSHWVWRDRRPHEALHIYLEPNFVQKIAEANNLSHDQMSIEPQIGIRDEQLSHMAMSLLCELKAENVVGRLYADSVASVLAIQLVRRYSCLKDIAIRKGGMAPHKLRRALEFISDKLEDQQGIALEVVAREVGMSRYHFSRVFKESMGLSPINYIGRQRIERAKKLLAETELPIADIALQAGFSGQSHFTTFFRNLVGLTPRSFRRAM
ncbi:MAG TPA: AraC family transcriptional regulator [Blastocatellia bacterium]|nr:AraC family transcriptional regulator [Blastocatellia bacterium]